MREYLSFPSLPWLFVSTRFSGLWCPQIKTIASVLRWIVINLSLQRYYVIIRVTAGCRILCNHNLSIDNIHVFCMLHVMLFIMYTVVTIISVIWNVMHTELSQWLFSVHNSYVSKISSPNITLTILYRLSPNLHCSLSFIFYYSLGWDD